jgi:hypothetical protein
MNSASGTAPIAMPLEEAWELLRDLGRARHYVPGLTDVQITTEQREGVGASRRVFSKRGAPMDETVVRWDEGRGFEIRLHRGEAGPPPPFREARFVYALVPDGERCRIETTLSWVSRWGVLGKLLDALVMRRAIGRTVQQVADGLAQHYAQVARAGAA